MRFAKEVNRIFLRQACGNPTTRICLLWFAIVNM